MHLRSCLALAALLTPLPAAAIDTTLTYQGALTDGGAPANGAYDLQFTLLDSRSNTIGPVLIANDVAVASGRFALELDFGAAAFTGGNRLLRVAVRPGASTGAFTLLAPDARVNAAPYAQTALDALSAVTVDDGAITSVKIADGSVTSADVLDATLGSVDLASASVTNAKLAPDAVTSDRIQDGAIVDADIAVNTIRGVSIEDETIADDDIGPGQVGASELATSAVTTTKIANDAVTAAKIATDAVGSLEIANNSIGVGDIAPNAFWIAGGNAGTSPSTHYLGTSDGQALRLQASGGIGVNHSTPQAPLHVIHNLAFENDEVARFSRTAAGTEWVSMNVAAGRPRLEFRQGAAATATIAYSDTSSGGVGSSSLDFFAAGASAGAPGSMRLTQSASFGGVFTVLSLNGQFGGGVIAEKPGGGSWSAPSDRRLKHDIDPLDGALDRLLELRGVTFVYNDAGKGKYPAGVQTGFVAQDVQRVFPDWVATGADGYLTVGAKGFEALTVEALRDLRAEKDVEIEALRAENADLRARLERLEARLAPR